MAGRKDMDGPPAPVIKRGPSRPTDYDDPEGPPAPVIKRGFPPGPTDYDDPDGPPAPVIKRGPRRMASGGAVKSSASSRADGCAARGKTKGRFV